MKKYVVGFAIDGGRVALIEKKRPDWQAGFLNGVGGHIEPGETPRAAMVREFAEETGVTIPAETWELFVVMTFPNAMICFYRARVPALVLDAMRSTTDEHVQPWALGGLWPTRALPNLKWLVPLAAYTADRYEVIYVTGAVEQSVDPS